MMYTNVSRYGNTIYARGFDGDGKRKVEVVKYEPTLYVTSNKPSEFHDLFTMQPVEPVKFDSIHAAADYIETYGALENSRLYGTDDWLAQFMFERFSRGPKPDTSLIRIGTLDIETDSEKSYSSPAEATNEVTAITLNFRNHFYVLGMVDFKCDPHRKDVQYLKCSDEKELLSIFIRTWDKLDLDVITGWNSDGYDLPYLINRIHQVLGDDELVKLSPLRHLPRVREVVSKSGYKTLRPAIDGIACLDYMLIYMNPIFTAGKREEYTLNFIAHHELGEAKTDYTEYGSLDQLYKQNPQLFIEYNIHDVELVVDLNRKLDFFSIIFATAYDTRCNYVDTLGSVHIWESIIYKHLMAKKIVAPIKRVDNIKDAMIAGAYVKKPQPGRYRWVVSFDASSLYPSLIRQLNVSPETFRGIQYPVSGVTDKAVWEQALAKARTENWTLASNGAAFTRDRPGCLAELMEHFYTVKSTESAKLLTMQKQNQLKPSAELANKIGVTRTKIFATKVLLNSCYGATSNPHFRFYNNGIAEAVTMSGQTLIQAAIAGINEHLNSELGTSGTDYVVASDTDSVYVCCEGIVDKAKRDGILAADASRAKVLEFMELLCQKHFNPMLETIMTDVAARMNAVACHVKMMREAIADDAIWIAAKNYIIRLWNNKGVTYHEPKYKIMGWDAVRSTYPELCRNAMKAVCPFVLDADQKQLDDYVQAFKSIYRKSPIRSIGKNGSANMRTKVETQAIRGSRVYNNLLRNKLAGSTEYAPIKNGSRVRLLTLRMPNPTGQDVIAFPDGKFPSEFGLDSYVDRDTMFDKLFMAPLRRLTNAAGMNSGDEASLSLFFT